MSIFSGYDKVDSYFFIHSMPIDDEVHLLTLPYARYLPPETIGQDLYQKLVKIRKALIQVLPSFPIMGCTETAAFLETELGLARIGGHYEGDGEKDLHVWNCSQDGRFDIDLTQQQFEFASSSIPEISILQVPNRILVPNLKITQEIEKKQLPDELLRRIRASLADLK